MRISVYIYPIFLFLIFSASPLYSKELPDWMKPLPIDPELLRPAVPEGFVLVKGGCFQMGDTFGDGENDEKPVHEVCVDDFYMGKYEVTVGEFREFVNTTGYRTEAEQGDGCFVLTGSKWEKDRNKNWRNLDFSQDDRHPVACVSWNDAQEYIRKLNEKFPLNKGGQGVVYRLPTEVEWEYAARSGGKNEKYAGGNDLDSVGWYNDNSGGKTHPAGQKKPNGLGLYDMTGNVWEWVQDWYDENYYKNSPKDNPRGASSGQSRVLRGGSWVDDAMGPRAANRNWDNPGNRNYFNGFRVARTK
ncbi:MAG: formylglycine-generating enzyme family protein [Nitrospinae bacterium]|nr:formylglycine-generating enzyme family protein [Nitrospinota bacterium]